MKSFDKRDPPARPNFDAFYDRWVQEFAPNLTEAEYNEKFVYMFPWHIFSYKIIPRDCFLVGDAARKAYDRIDKTGAFVYQLWGDEDEPQPVGGAYDTSAKLDELPETYVTAADFSWTYISTHENDCQGLGPFFMKK